jgi:hypothetical protein
MKTLFLTIVITLAFGVFQFAGAQTNQTLKVQINQQKTLPKSKLTIKFLSLVEDSRCPTDTNCVWAGNAQIKVKISKGKESKTFDLNTNLDPNIVSFAGYEIKLAALNPKPASNIRINRNGYTATFAVSKAGAKISGTDSSDISK